MGQSLYPLEFGWAMPTGVGGAFGMLRVFPRQLVSPWTPRGQGQQPGRGGLADGDTPVCAVGC